jgi:RNA polymerase sigma factor (sigma-70 family)
MNDMVLLVEPLLPALRRYARALLRNRTEADDLVQDCLERAVRRWHQRRTDGSPRPWLFSILHNLAMNHLGQRRPGRRVPIEDADEGALATSPRQPDALRHRDLLRGLEQLSLDQRTVLLLVAVEGVTYAEAAQILDIPVGTVMSRLARARGRLLQLMEGENEQPAVPVAHLRRIQ